MINLNFSLVVAIVYVLILYAFMNRFFFQPILKILHERRALIQGRLEEARQRMNEVEEKASEYEQALQNARSEAYRQQEQQRERVLAEKADLIGKAKAEADQAVRDGRARLASEAEAARNRLQADVDSMARRLSATILRD
jgi:F-type H+-transporting ATPase subunit b